LSFQIVFLLLKHQALIVASSAEVMPVSDIPIRTPLPVQRAILQPISREFPPVITPQLRSFYLPAIPTGEGPGRSFPEFRR
jgi:hypothetical protein